MSDIDPTDNAVSPPLKTAINAKGERLGLAHGEWMPPIPDGFALEEPPLPEGFKLEAARPNAGSPFTKTAVNAKGERMGLASGQWLPPIPDGFALEEPPLPEGFRLEETPTMDVLKSAGSGIVQGAAGIPGAAGDAQSFLQRYNPGDWLAKKFEEHFPETAKANRALADKVGRISDIGEIRLPTTDQITKATGADALDYAPQTTAGKFARSVGEFVPGAVAGPVKSVPGLLGNVAKFAVAPGLVGEGAGELAESAGLSPEKAAIARMVAGLAAPGVAHFATSPNRVGGPAASEASHAGQVARLEQEGLPVSAGERADSSGLRYAEDAFNHNAYKEKMEAVTRAATRQVGNGRGGTYETPIMERAGHNTLDTMLSETGQRIGDLAARNTFHPDANLGVDIMNLRQHYTTNPGLYDEAAVKSLNAAADKLRDAMSTNAARSGGQPYLTGNQYHNIYSDVRRLARETDNPQRAGMLNEFANALGENMERSIARTNPADAGKWAEANKDYRNALVIEKA
jgi:hypothetical protein